MKQASPWRSRTGAGAARGFPLRGRAAALAVLALSVGCGAPLLAGAGAAPSPSFTPGGELRRPADYREWVYVTSGLGMTYGPGQATENRPPMFDNVFVTRDAYREFLRSGTWPQQTMFILEVRRSEEKVSISNGGRTQGAIVAIEASVKDRKRFPPDGWGYFTFDGKEGLAGQAAPLPATAQCYSCHRDHTAVDNTFVQFYPTLFEVAKRLGTVKPAFRESGDGDRAAPGSAGPGASAGGEAAARH